MQRAFSSGIQPLEAPAPAIPVCGKAYRRARRLGDGPDSNDARPESSGRVARTCPLHSSEESLVPSPDVSAKPILVAALLSLSQSAWPDAMALAVYPAFAAPGAARAHFIEGRVIELSRSSEPAATDGKRTNLRRNLALLVNSELEAHPVRVHVAGVEYNTLSDAEGYFRIQVEDTDALTAGWNRITATSEGATTDGALLLTPAANVHGLISDLDDTILITEVHSKRRMLANTLFGNPLQRRAVSGTAQLYHRLAGRNTDPGAAPIFYLSASPRQLHAAIQSFLDHNQFPRGVLTPNASPMMQPANR
jgi:hypothetical protein